MKVWGLVPARGGSKSIPRKNIVPLRGRPLLDYGVRAAQASGMLECIVCSTDDADIAARAHTLGLDVVPRAPELASDDAKVDAVAQAFLLDVPAVRRPDAVVLVQPTSPFLLPEHVRKLIEALNAAPDAASAHNVAMLPHNLHAWNQRELKESGRVNFLFPAERKQARNKQEKPVLYAFGNLIMARTSALLRGDGFYAEPVIAIPIERPYEFDLDGPADIAVAEALLTSKAVFLPHLDEMDAVTSTRLGR
jgi:CMP-N-acetylneuraminic acid synthetase